MRIGTRQGIVHNTHKYGDPYPQVAVHCAVSVPGRSDQVSLALAILLSTVQGSVTPRLWTILVDA